MVVDWFHASMDVLFESSDSILIHMFTSLILFVTFEIDQFFVLMCLCVWFQKI